MLEKINKFKRILKEKSLEYAFINSPENIYYFTGLTPNQLAVSRNPIFSILIIRTEDNKLILSTMDYENACFEKVAKEIVLEPYVTWVGLKTKEDILNNKDYKHEDKTIYDVIKIILERQGKKVSRIGLELASITPIFYDELKTRFPNVTFVNISDDLIFSRSVKTKIEIDKFREITEVCDKALLEMSKNIRVGISEKELAQYYRKYLFDDGRFLPSTWTMLGFGENSSCLSRPTEKRLEINHSIRFDGGANAEFDFYTTDFSRSWLMPDADNLLKKIKPVLYKAQRKMIESIKPGLKFNELFSIGFDYVKKAIPNYTRGHLGHSISLGPQTAEMPFINSTNDRDIEEGMILCVEVPLYISDLGGFNIEDMVLVNSDGCEVLTYRTPHFLDFEKEYYCED